MDCFCVIAEFYTKSGSENKLLQILINVPIYLHIGPRIPRKAWSILCLLLIDH